MINHDSFMVIGKDGNKNAVKNKFKKTHYKPKLRIVFKRKLLLY